MVTSSAFRRRVSTGTRRVEVDLPAAEVRWVGAQQHSGENIGDTPTHTIFVELKGSSPGDPVSGEAPLGPATR